MGYQSFGDSEGDSRSHAKLHAVRMPQDLAGKAVLDIGCNEGFFCGQALARGATRVVGIDSNAAVIEAAKNRFPQVEFLCTSWWELPPGEFDVILFLSAIHYEYDQKRLLNRLRHRLKDDGLLILECGVIRDDRSKDWRVIERHDGVLSYPSWPLLVEDLLEDYAVRDVGPSVEQSGDPIPRYVFHCSPYKPTVLLISGPSYGGKTVTAREFSRSGARVINTDFLIGALVEDNKSGRHPGLRFLQQEGALTSLDTTFEAAARSGVAPAINDLILHAVRPDRRLTIIEGYQLGIAEFRSDIVSKLTAKGYRVMESRV